MCVCREASAAGDEGDFDPFKRRSCRPKILWSVGQHSPTRPPSPPAAGGGGGGAAGDANAGGAAAPGASKPPAAASVANGVAGGAGRGAGESGLQDMHSFGGVDVMEAGRVALEKRVNAVKTKAAPRGEGGKLTLGKYLEKARVDA